SSMSNSNLYNPLLRKSLPLKRVVGEICHDAAGPLFIVLAGVHGNEPSGVQAVQKVFEEVSTLDAPFRGTFVGIVGNLAALRAGRRYIDEDLNRIWLSARVDGLREGRKPENTEERELQQILEVLDSYRDHQVARYFLDC